MSGEEGIIVVRKLTAEQLRAVCRPEDLGIKTTEDLTPLEGIVGQERALQSLQFGLAIRDPGFNIYVAGESGTGRRTAINEYLEQVARGKPVPPDWCYVHNFKDSYQPKALQLNAGQGSKFAKDMALLVETVRREVPKAFETDEYAKQKEETLSSFNRRRDELMSSMNERAARQGFMLQATPVGLMIYPLIRGRPMNEQDLAALPPDARQRIMKEREQLETELLDILRDIRAVEREANQALEKLDRQTALFVIGHLFDQMKEAYKDNPQVIQHLDEMQEDMLQNIALLRGQVSAQVDTSAPRLSPSWAQEVAFRKYAVNVLIDNSDLTGAPVIMEFNAAYTNLFGRIEKEAQMGVLATDFTLVRAGSLHRANGGFLVIPVEELLRNPLAYEGLKRALRSRELSIEEPSERLGLMVTKTLRPQPIPLDVKVVLVGTALIYQYLYLLDPDFSELFKVKAEFDTTMDRTPDNVKTYAALMCKLCSKENLRHMDGPALALIIEHGSRLAGDQRKLSTKFSEIADIIREANFYADRDGRQYIGRQHIERALEAKVYRSNLIESRYHELIRRGVLRIETSGTAVGEVNGLSVLGLGDTVFGRPARITATVGPGREGIIDIERAVNLGGAIHSKGVLILGGYLTQRYARDIPLNLNARIVFEQSYEPVEGDSASCAELLALLSAISGVPLKRSFAVTGSVNQAGEVQAIGGVNEKIEGFYEACKIKGFDREQGVIIPESNVQNLMLKDEVVRAVEQGKFHIYAISSVDEAIELLTGRPAGQLQPDGTYPEGSVNRLVSERLQKMAEAASRYYPERG